MLTHDPGRYADAETPTAVAEELKRVADGVAFGLTQGLANAKVLVLDHRLGGNSTPTIVIHGSRTKHIAPAYRRYLEGFFRKRFRLEGTPVRIEFREGENPYAGKKNVLTEGQQRKRQRMISEMKRRKR